MKQIAMLALVGIMGFSCSDQKPFPTYKEAKNMKTQNMVSIPELVNANIPGAPTLSQPVQIQGEIDEIITEKHGYAYPALYDWNRDGKKDLLVGEFETGATGSYLQVHLNEGTNAHPRFSGKFEYAKDIKGDTITADYWCCIGFHPRFVDLTGDGIKDLVTGSYYPGIISMWEGTAEGFKPVVEVEQEGNPREDVKGLPFVNNKSDKYWNYSSVDFFDFNKDGLYDLFVSGSGGVRVALNTGSKEKPKFGYRQLLLDVDGHPLYLREAKVCENYLKKGKIPVSGDMKSYVNPYDWDGDGVIDLLVTSSYSYEEQNPIEFFKGVTTPKGIRFEQRQPLFTRADGKNRPFPGSGTQVRVEDYNEDGTPDLLIGMSMLTVSDYRIVDSLVWKPLEHYGLPRIGKDLGAGYGDPNEHNQLVEDNLKMKESGSDRKFSWFDLRKLDDDVKDIYSSRHKGYVFVMYGKKNKEKAEVKNYFEAKDFVLPEIYKIKTQTALSTDNGPVKISIETTDNPDPFKKPLVIKVKMAMEKGWYLYADTKHNRDNAYVISEVKFKASGAISKVGEVVTPKVSNPKGVAKYKGDELVFEQNFHIGMNYFTEKNNTVDVEITYQTCNKDMCHPPVTMKETLKFQYKRQAR